MSNQMIMPEGDEQLPATRRKASKVKQSIKPSDLEKAAKTLGFTTINAESLKSAGLIGRFIEEVGAFHIGRAKLVVSSDNLQIAAEKYGRFIDEIEDPEIKVKAMAVHASLLNGCVNAAEALIKTAGSGSRTTAPPNVPGFAPGQPVMGTQVVVHTSKADSVSVNGMTIDSDDQG